MFCLSSILLWWYIACLSSIFHVLLMWKHLPWQPQWQRISYHWHCDHLKRNAGTVWASPIVHPVLISCAGPLSPSDILLFSLHIEACDCISDIQNFLHIELLNIMYCLTSSEYLNWYRYNHEANGVKWDSGLTYKAYEATNAMCARGFDHHPGTEAEYGSLWAHSNRCEDVSGGALVTALQSWYSECPLYTGESSWQISGHFTQMVWRKSTKYGMWAQSCSSPDG